MDFTVAGLQILRDNNLIHRDLKPQVWLILFCLSSNSDLYMAMYMIISLREEARLWQNLSFLFFIVFKAMDEQNLYVV